MAFCHQHCAAAKSSGIPTLLREYLKHKGVGEGEIFFESQIICLIQAFYTSSFPAISGKKPQAFA